MDQGQDDKLQQAIDQVAQNTTDNSQSDPIVPQRTMTSDSKDSSNDEAVAAAMASVLPQADTTPPSVPTPPSILPTPSAAPMPTPVESAAPATPTASTSTDMDQVKEQALRELIPLLSNMQIEPDQKFKIYRDMIETLHDNSVAMPALEAAKQISDENTRAEALLSLVNIIDGLNNK